MSPDATLQARLEDAQRDIETQRAELVRLREELARVHRSRADTWPDYREEKK